MTAYHRNTNFLFVVGALLAMTGCAQNRAKIAYTSPPMPPATHHSGPAFAGPGTLLTAAALDDVGMTDAVQSALIADPRIRATNVQIRARKQVVTLQGVLNSQAAKDAATQDCFRVQGVRHVNNLISIDPEG